MTAAKPHTLNVFDPNTHIQTITVVGLGGTGAQIARSVARMVYDMKGTRLHTPQIVLIDPDKVEHKNVGRQLYTEADVGQSKAHVLMRRFNMALGLDIIAIDQPVNAERHFERWGNLIVGAVDNHLARRELRLAIEEFHAQIPEYELAGSPAISWPSGTLHLRSLPLRWTV